MDSDNNTYVNNATEQFSSKFAQEVASWLIAESIRFTQEKIYGLSLFRFPENTGFSVVCIDLANRAIANKITAQEEHETQNGDIPPMVLWEDVWYRKTEIVKSRILAQTGRSIKIPARLTRIERIDKPTADKFLQENHLNGTVAARYRFGLFLPSRYFNRLPEYLVPNGDRLLIAVATFAAPRTFSKENTPYKSGELTRLASIHNTTVIGGLSKLINHFAEKYQTDDVMTYVDREWSSGISFKKSGFVFSGHAPPVDFLVDMLDFERYPVHRMDNKLRYRLGDRLLSIKNAGSHKLLRHYFHEKTTKSDVVEKKKVLSSSPPYDIIFVLGPTASGKTALATRLAYEIGGEIISLDSRQIYRGMDIGSGKDLDEYKIDNQNIPYHLIDILHPGTAYSVHAFKQDFAKVYTDLRSKGKTIIACGGSGLYIEAVLNWLLHENDEESVPSMLILALNPQVETRRARIIDRLQKRLDAGLISEVKALIQQGVSEQTLIHYGLEYKYVTQYLQQKVTYSEMVNSLGNEIVRFSKRQMTFLKKIERSGYFFHWLPTS